MLQMRAWLQTKELQEWADNPEEFSQQAGTGVWQDSLRTCAETLFTTLLGVIPSFRCSSLLLCATLFSLAAGCPVLTGRLALQALLQGNTLDGEFVDEGVFNEFHFEFEFVTIF